jgi:hypothetical protein
MSSAARVPAWRASLPLGSFLVAQRYRCFGGIDSAWDSVKQGFIDSYNVLSDSFSKTWSEFGEDDPVASVSGSPVTDPSAIRTI